MLIKTALLQKHILWNWEILLRKKSWSHINTWRACHAVSSFIQSQGSRPPLQDSMSDHLHTHTIQWTSTWLQDLVTWTKAMIVINDYAIDHNGVWVAIIHQKWNKHTHDIQNQPTEKWPSCNTMGGKVHLFMALIVTRGFHLLNWLLWPNLWLLTPLHQLVKTALSCVRTNQSF